MKTYDKICDIIDSYVKTIYVTPYMLKQYIPSENIRAMKEEILAVLKGEGKRN